MYAWRRGDWSQQSAAEHLAAAREASPIGLRDLLRRYDWDLHPEPVLGWVLSQRGINLGSALTAFFNGTPERFNDLAKRDVPPRFHPAARVLDNICLRVNCGFYAAEAGCEVDQDRLERWISQQSRNRGRDQSGRWVLDEGIVGVLARGGAGPVALPPRAPVPTGLRGWVATRLRPRDRTQPGA